MKLPNNNSFMTIIVCTLLAISFTTLSIALDTSNIITPNDRIDDTKTIVSKNGIFELCFFNKSNKHYIGIWYKNILSQNIVWVANGGKPINVSSSHPFLRLNGTGHLVLAHMDDVVWVAAPLKEAKEPVAELHDCGNFVIRERNALESDKEGYLWQSFDYPSNTMLAGMKLGWHRKRNLDRSLVAWISDDDPAPSDFRMSLALHNYPDIYMTKGTGKVYRIGPWNGLRFSGMPELKSNPIFNFTFVNNEDEIYYSWHMKDPSLINKAVLNQTGYGRPRYVWSKSDTTWRLYSTLPGDYCDTYGLCGPNGYCNITDSPVCQCLEWFKPQSPSKWNSMDWSEGCVRIKPLRCKDGLKDWFVLVHGLKVPDTENTTVDTSIGLEQCKQKCLSNCSCMAYTNSNISGSGKGCVMWFNDLIDIKKFAVGGQSLYIRISASELGK